MDSGSRGVFIIGIDSRLCFVFTPACLSSAMHLAVFGVVFGSLIASGLALKPVFHGACFEADSAPIVYAQPGVHTNDFVPIHGRRARIHTAPAEDNTSNQRSMYCFPQALCE